MIIADVPADGPPKDAKFCAIELQDGAYGLSYVLLGDTLDALTGARPGVDTASTGWPERMRWSWRAGSTAAARWSGHWRWPPSTR
jgi:hypothetical protein